VTVFFLLAATYWVLCLMCAYAFRALEWVLPLNRALRTAQAATKTARRADMQPAGAV
jgi:polar amino acid transport system permease protein